MNALPDFPQHPRATANISARPEVIALGASKIREVANAGLLRGDVLPFWFGEPDQVTPKFICDRASEALAAGETFYSSNFGIMPLRETIATYISALHQPVDADRIAVTSSGVSALMMAAQTLFSPGDRVVIVTPIWPNLTEGPRILGAEVIRVSLRVQNDRWQLDLDELIAALTPQTRALVINSPNNPTGWVIDRKSQEDLLAHCRHHGIWIIGDDVYERLMFEGAIGDRQLAPSFLDIAEPGDRVISTNSFSKSWLMTGWRLGWLVSPKDASGKTLLPDIGKLIEYNTSCAPPFVQLAGITAIEGGEPVIRETRTRYQANRDILCDLLEDIDGVRVMRPGGAMYVFFKIAAAADSLSFCKDLVEHVGLGLAPGVAFGPEGEGYVRWCLAASPKLLEEGVSRLKKFLSR
jgi:aspartate/methionine/tyrosine aminotransferase